MYQNPYLKRQELLNVILFEAKKMIFEMESPFDPNPKLRVQPFSTMWFSANKKIERVERLINRTTHNVVVLNIKIK